MSKCTCSCDLNKHRRGGCKTWYGDKNTGFGCNCDWDGKPEAETKEHHVLVVVRSSDRYVDVMTSIVAAVREKLGVAVEARGIDYDKERSDYLTALEERNAAVTESHNLRCELEHLRRHPTGCQCRECAVA